MLFGNDDGTLWQNVILTYVFTPKLFLSTKPVKTKSFQKSNSIICEFQIFAYFCTQEQETAKNMATTRNIAGKKIANEMTSSLLIHPGEMIKDEIIARGMTQKELAQQMGVSYTVFNEILNGKRPVTTEYALLLEAALGTDANVWLGLQADYNMQKMKQDHSFMKRLEKIRKNAAIF